MENLSVTIDYLADLNTIWEHLGAVLFPEHRHLRVGYFKERWLAEDGLFVKF